MFDDLTSPKAIDRIRAMQADPVKSGIGLDVPQTTINAQSLASSFGNACGAQLRAGADPAELASHYLERMRAHLQAQDGARVPGQRAHTRLCDFERVSLADVIAIYNRGRV